MKIKFHQRRGVTLQAYISPKWIFQHLPESNLLQEQSKEREVKSDLIVSDFKQEIFDFTEKYLHDPITVLAFKEAENKEKYISFSKGEGVIIVALGEGNEKKYYERRIKIDSNFLEIEKIRNGEVLSEHLAQSPEEIRENIKLVRTFFQLYKGAFNRAVKQVLRNKELGINDQESNKLLKQFHILESFGGP